MDKKILRTLAVLTLGVGLNTLTADNADAGMTYKELPTQVRMAIPRVDAGLQLGDDACAVVPQVMDDFGPKHQVGITGWTRDASTVSSGIAPSVSPISSIKR